MAKSEDFVWPSKEGPLYVSDMTDKHLFHAVRRMLRDYRTRRGMALNPDDADRHNEFYRNLGSGNLNFESDDSIAERLMLQSAKFNALVTEAEVRGIEWRGDAKPPMEPKLNDVIGTLDLLMRAVAQMPEREAIPELEEAIKRWHRAKFPPEYVPSDPDEQPPRLPGFYAEVESHGVCARCGALIDPEDPVMPVTHGGLLLPICADCSEADD